MVINSAVCGFVNRRGARALAATKHEARVPTVWKRSQREEGDSGILNNEQRRSYRKLEAHSKLEATHTHTQKERGEGEAGEWFLFGL